MRCKNALLRGVLLAICATVVACLKKDNFYCEMSSACTCVTANNDKIDLKGINLSWNITTTVSLNYQPCPNEVQNPKTVAIELVYNAADNTTNTTTIPVANYMDVKFEIGDAVMLVYKNSSYEFDVILSCDSLATSGNEYLTDFHNDTSDHCSIVLKTSKVCDLNLKDAYENRNSDSWTFFFSFILIVAFIYFVCGSIVNACLFNEIGVNMIPHHQFWSSLYNNIKEKFCGASMMASAYESI